jgi:hypothetical protein
MQISSKDWENYIKKLNELNETAGRLMSEYISKHGFGDTDAIISYAYGLITKYGEGSAALSAAMYDAIAEMSGKTLPPAEVAPTADYKEVAEAVNGTIKQSSNPKTTGSTVSRLVKQAGADTMLKNAERDGAQFAWVPSGDTCAFCLTLASNGFQYMSENAKKNGHAEHIHANCDCNYTVRFDNKSGVQSYDPKKYKEIYDNADGDINEIRRMQYRENKNRINAQKRETYAERKKDADDNNKQLRIEAASPFKNPDTPLTVYQYDQSKHFKGGDKYNEYMKTHEYPPSYLTISEKEVQELVDKYHGTGILKLDRNGNLARSELIVDNERIIGRAVNDRNGKEVATSTFKIHYSSKGTHVVPAYESQKQYWKEKRAQNGYDWILRQKS